VTGRAEFLRDQLGFCGWRAQAGRIHERLRFVFGEEHPPDIDGQTGHTQQEHQANRGGNQDVIRAGVA
jgi:hypothetical protein